MKTILLVDDSETVRNAIATVLKFAGYSVLQAENGLDAIKLAKMHSDQIDLIVTDVFMPQMTGPEFVWRVKQFCPGIPALFLSGDSQNFLIQEGLLVDSDNFVSKPLSLEALLLAVRISLDETDSEKQ